MFEPDKLFSLRVSIRCMHGGILVDFYLSEQSEHSAEFSIDAGF